MLRNAVLDKAVKELLQTDLLDEQILGELIEVSSL